MNGDEENDKIYNKIIEVQNDNMRLEEDISNLEKEYSDIVIGLKNSKSCYINYDMLNKEKEIGDIITIKEKNLNEIKEFDVSATYIFKRIMSIMAQIEEQNNTNVNVKNNNINDVANKDKLDDNNDINKDILLSKDKNEHVDKIDEPKDNDDNNNPKLNANNNIIIEPENDEKIIENLLKTKDFYVINKNNKNEEYLELKKDKAAFIKNYKLTQKIFKFLNEKNDIDKVMDKINYIHKLNINTEFLLRYFKLKNNNHTMLKKIKSNDEVDFKDDSNANEIISKLCNEIYYENRDNMHKENLLTEDLSKYIDAANDKLETSKFKKHKRKTILIK